MASRPARGGPGAWAGVLNQGPLMSSTGVYRLEHMLAAKPSAMRTRRALVRVGDPAPDVRLEGTDGSTFTVTDFRGTPIVMKLTRAVTDRII